MRYIKGQFDYNILDQEAYNRFFMGKKPKTKQAFTWVTEESGRTFSEAADKFGVTMQILYIHSSTLQIKKIIEKAPRIKPVLPRRIKKPILGVYHSRLAMESYSTGLRIYYSRGWKRECPFCHKGLFPVRDQDTFELQEYDSCNYCGQRIRYLDIESMRAREK